MARDHITVIRNDQGGVAKAEKQSEADKAQAEAQAKNEPSNPQQAIASNYVDGDGSGNKQSRLAGKAQPQEKKQTQQNTPAPQPSEENLKKAEETQIKAADVTNPATSQEQNAKK